MQIYLMTRTHPPLSLSHSLSFFFSLWLRSDNSTKKRCSLFEPGGWFLCPWIRTIHWCDCGTCCLKRKLHVASPKIGVMQRPLALDVVPISHRWVHWWLNYILRKAISLLTSWNPTSHGVYCRKVVGVPVHQASPRKVCVFDPGNYWKHWRQVVFAMAMHLVRVKPLTSLIWA